MAILKIRDENGEVHEILAIRGEDYILTEQDKEEIASMISDSDGNGNFSALTDHKNDKSNPHEVTAQQIGAVTQEELQEALGSIVIPEGGDPEALNEHIADKNNPHNVTCKQIGAASEQDYNITVQEIRDDIQANWDMMYAHEEDTNNPHGVTCEQIGAFPDGEFQERFYGELDWALTEMDYMRQITNAVIKALPVYDGSVV